MKATPLPSEVRTIRWTLWSPAKSALIRFPFMAPLKAPDLYSSKPFALGEVYLAIGGTYAACGGTSGEYGAPFPQTHSPRVGFGCPAYEPLVTRCRRSGCVPTSIDGVAQFSAAPGVSPWPRFGALSFKYRRPLLCHTRS